MAVDLLSPRTDLPFLTRRVRPGSEPKPVAASTPRPSLRLSDPTKPEKAPYSNPLLTGDVTLSSAAPVVRLNRRQSAIGSLTISGATRILWEADGTAGVQNVADGDDDPRVPIYGGRPLVQGYKGAAVVGLRHFSHLRRVIIEGTDIAIQLPSGRKITVEPTSDGSLVRITVLRLGGELEIRREHEDSGNDFGFSNVAQFTGSSANDVRPAQGRRPREQVEAQLLQAAVLDPNRSASSIYREAMRQRHSR